MQGGIKWGETFNTAGKFLNLGAQTIQRFQEVPESDEIHQAPPSPSIYKQQGPAELPERSSIFSVGSPERSLDPEMRERDSLQSFELYVGCSWHYRFPAFVSYHWCWSKLLELQVFLTYFYSCEKSLTHILVSNPNKR